MSVGTWIAAETSSKRYGMRVELVFYMESNKVGDYSQTLLTNWIVSMKNESLYDTPFSTYFLINSYILTRIELYELYLAI